MKKVSISFTYDEEKLNAVRMFLAQKNVELENELSEFMEGLYKKQVPAGVREFIEMMEVQAGREKDKRKPPARPTPQSAPIHPPLRGQGEQG